LAQLLESDRLPEPVAVPSVPGLFVLPAGGTASNSSEILGSQRMYRLIQEYKARADVVLVDSPPLWYSDALALAPQVDGALLVVSSGTTGRENTINAVESLRLVGARIIGTVMNRVKAGPAYFYYPTYAANRVALEGSNNPAIAASAAPRALAAAPNAPTAPSEANQPPAGQPSPESVPGGLVEPLPTDLHDDTVADPALDGGSDRPQVSAHARGEQVDRDSLYSTAVLDVTAPELATDAEANAALAAPSDELVAADDSDLSRAMGEPVVAYGQVDDQSDDADSAALGNANGHRFPLHRRNKNR
jgi:hypothetical protein